MARNRVWQTDLMDMHRAGQISDTELMQISAPIGRRPQLLRHDCGAHVLVGLDADRCALTARVEPYPLTALGEVEALRAGRWTYRLLRGALDRRDRWNIPGHPPTPEVPVLAAHVCGQPLPATWLAPPPPRPARQPAAEGMPF